MATRKPAAKKTAKEQLADIMLKLEALQAEAAAEEIENIVASTKVVAEYNKLRKDADGNVVKNYVILTAIAKAVGAKDVEIKEKKAKARKPRDPNKPVVPRKPRAKSTDN
jgi:hypothetical protein